MEWSFYSLDERPVNYDDLSKNKEIAVDIKINPEISANYKISEKIYNVGILDIENRYAGVHEINFADIEEVDEMLEESFTCPYCGYIHYDAFELDDEGEINCPGCNSELEFERIVTVEYNVIPKKKADVIKVG